MKATGVLLVLSLALGCFSGVKSSDENDGIQVSCDKYRVFEEFLACPRIFSPVCGTNGKTYDNECSICQDNAENGQNIGMKYKGRCAEEHYCGTMFSPVSVCTMEYNVHCGSNNENYNNKCEFCIAVRNSMVPLTLKHLGQCNSTH